ncbi:MAG: phosphotransferase, partial [Planctomycetota bacterium]
FVLRVRPAEVADEESIRFDHEVLRRLAATGLPFPAPLARNDGSTWLRLGDRVYEVLPWVSGEPFDYGDVEAVHRLGAFLARFHQALSQGVPPGKEGRLREDHPSLLEPYVSGLCRLASNSRERRQLERISEQLEHVRGHLDSGLYASLPHCVIHGDIHPGNVGFQDSRVSAVYDFDYLSLQARVRDISDGLILFASARDSPLAPDDIRSLTQPFVPDVERCRLLLEGYRQAAELTESEWRALPLVMRSRWIQMRLRGSRKVPEAEKVGFVLDRFFEVIGWLDRAAPGFFSRLRAALERG